MTINNWQKIGRIFKAEGQKSWMQSHTTCPVALHLNGDRYRVYFGTRDAENHPSVGFVVIDVKEPTRVLSVSDNPVLCRGDWGCFDDNGVYPGSIIQTSTKILMYYMGRSNGLPPLYYMSIGLAESLDGGVSFKRVVRSPLLGRSEWDPWMTSTPFVMQDNQCWHMWYLSGIGWEDVKTGKSLYHIKYAQSRNGIEWLRTGQVAIDLEENESNVASPWVWRENGIYKMVFCTYSHGNTQGLGYQLGLAFSEDAIRWHRLKGQFGLGYSTTGWDSQCMAYPSIFEHGGSRYLLYSGNGNGRDGFGIAVQDIFKKF